MQFRIGDKVKCKEKSLSKFSASVVSRIKHGGIVISTTNLKGFPLVNFGDKIKYFMWKDDLELLVIKNQQLLFSFMQD